MAKVTMIAAIGSPREDQSSLYALMDDGCIMMYFRETWREIPPIPPTNKEVLSSKLALSDFPVIIRTPDGPHKMCLTHDELVNYPKCQVVETGATALSLSNWQAREGR